jgi:hypothetical protein
VIPDSDARRSVAVTNSLNGAKRPLYLDQRSGVDAVKDAGGLGRRRYDMRRNRDLGLARHVEQVSNVIIALDALERLGGARRYVDIEEVTLEAYRMAPERFSWRTKRDYPSWERVRTAFVHANQGEQKRHGGPLVVSSTDGSSWKLTVDGLAFVRLHAGRIERAVSRGARSSGGGTPSAKRIREIRKHPAFIAYENATPIGDIARHELAELLLSPPDAPREAVRRKLDRARTAALDVRDHEVARFLEELGMEVERKWS